MPTRLIYGRHNHSNHALNSHQHGCSVHYRSLRDRKGKQMRQMSTEEAKSIGSIGGKAKARATRQTRSWYMKQLLDIAMGKRKCTGPQLTALCKFAEQRGWYPPNHKRNVISKENLKKLAHKPAITDDLEARLSALIPKPQPAQQPMLPSAITSVPINTQLNGQTATNA